MRIFEKTLYVLFIIGLILRYVLRIPGGGVTIVLSASILACLYFTFGFALILGIRLRNVFKKESYDNQSSRAIVFSVLAGLVGLAPLLTGLMFKAMSWPAANTQLIGAMSMSIVFIAIALFKSKLPLSKRYLTRAIPLFISALVLSQIPERAWIEFSSPSQLEIYDAEQTMNNQSQEEWDKKVSWYSNKRYSEYEGRHLTEEVNGEQLHVFRNQNYFSITNSHGDTIVRPQPTHKDYYFYQTPLGRKDLVVTHQTESSISQFLDSADYYAYNSNNSFYERHPLIKSQLQSLINKPNDEDSLFACSTDFTSSENQILISHLFKFVPSGLEEEMSLKADYTAANGVMVSKDKTKATLGMNYQAIAWRDLSDGLKESLCQPKVLSDERFPFFWMDYLRDQRTQSIDE